MNGKRSVVAGVNELGPFFLGSELLVIGRWRNAKPHFAKRVQVGFPFEALADVPRREAFPQRIGEVGRAVIEDVDLDTRVVRGSQESVAGAKAGPDNSQPREALAGKPVETGAGIDHRLAGRVNRAA